MSTSFEAVNRIYREERKAIPQQNCATIESRQSWLRGRMRTRIESRITTERVLFRMSCQTCGRVGAWLQNLSNAEHSAMLHDKAHAEEERKAS